jgi:hypothetical protein
LARRGSLVLRPETIPVLATSFSRFDGSTISLLISLKLAGKRTSWMGSSVQTVLQNSPYGICKIEFLDRCHAPEDGLETKFHAWTLKIVLQDNKPTQK